MTLINPKLQGISYWKNKTEGIIFIYTAEKYKGLLKESSEEGILEWINIDDLNKIRQFDQNQKFTPYLFKNNIFEGKFIIDNSCKVKEYIIRNI